MSIGSTNVLIRLAHRIGWGRVAGAALLLTFLALRIADPIPLQLLRLKVFDTYQLIKPREAIKRPVVIVDIDNASLEAHGQWPWPRTLVAELIERITAGAAVAIGLDVVFAEPDRTSPRLIAEALPELSGPIRDAIRNLRDHDEIFADTLLSSRVVLGQSAYNPKSGAEQKVSAPKASFATMGGDPKAYLIKYPDLLANIQILEDAASGRGMFTVIPDPDGVIRRVPVVLVAKNTLVPSLSADLLRVATGQTTYLIKSGPNGISQVVIGRVPMSTDATGQVWVHFSPHHADRFISAKDILSGKISMQKLAGKLVLIGTSASGLLDLRATPVDPVMPGVEIHAQVLESILTRTLLKRPDYAIGAEVMVTLLVGIAIIVLAPILGAATVFILGLALATILVGGSWYFFSVDRLLLDVAYPLTSSFAVFVVMLSINYFREEAERRQIRGAFGQYLSPTLVEQLADDPDKLALGGDTREMTILFSDVRGFTTISESYKDDPQGLTTLMNRFLTPLSNAVMEQDGTIDKYMGDAIMAFWNAPLEDADHATNACTAALEMLERLETVNTEREQEAKEAGQAFARLDVGVGINTGECVVGNMGSEVRFDYTVLGDAVNLASRLEGQSRVYGMRTIIGETTAKLAGDSFATMELDAIRVKGKSEPEVIYTILGPRNGADTAQYESTQASVGAILAAYRKRDWTGAMKAIRAARKADNGFNLSGLCDLYEERIAEFRQTPPPKNWDGVFTATSK